MGDKYMRNVNKMKVEKRRCMYAVILGILIGFSMVWGYQLQTVGKVSYDKIGMWSFSFIIAAFFSILSYFLLEVKINFRAKGFKKLSIGWFSVLCFGGLYGCWIIQLLGVYPGFFNYDAPGQWEMYAIGQVTAHHPVIHTLLISKCMHLSFELFGKSQPGVFLYELIQLFVTALAFTKVFRYMYKKKTPIVFVGILYLWCAIFPTVILSAFSVTKDSLFAPLVVMFVVTTVEILDNVEDFFSKWYKMAAWGITAILMTIMRNNAVYVAIPFFFFLIWVFRKYWKKYLILLISMMLLYGLYMGPFTSYITVDGIASKEYLSVPCQQIMRVYHIATDLDVEKKEEIEFFFREEALVLYVPKIADVAKGNLKIDVFEDNKAQFLKLWAELGAEYPTIYVDAFLVGNYGFWYPWATLAMYADGTEGYWVSKSYNPVWNESKIYLIEQYYTLFGYNEIVCENPFTMWIFAPATYLWITIFSFIVSLYKKRKEIVIFAYVLLVWLTFLLGPVALVRYVSFLYYLFPFTLVLILNMWQKNTLE